MDTGTIGFFDYSAVRHVKGVKKDKFIVNRINKTKQEKFPDLPGSVAYILP